MASDVWRELAAKIRSVARTEALNVSAPPTKWRVVATAPLQLVSLKDENDVLVEGDDDFDVGDGLDPSKGDIMLVHEDHAGDYVAIAVVK